MKIAPLESWIMPINSKMKKEPYAAIFGSSLLTGADSEITEWQEVPRVIASTNWGMLSGGYEGTMRFFSERHKAAGGHSIGIVCDTVSDTCPHHSYSAVISVSTPFRRMEALMRLSSAYIILPGGIGTMVELATALWIQDRRFQAQCPIIVLGTFWDPWLEWICSVKFGLRGTRSLHEIVYQAKTIEMFESYWRNFTNVEECI